MTSIALSTGTSLTTTVSATTPAISPLSLPKVSFVPVAQGVSSQERPPITVDTVSIQNKVLKKVPSAARETGGSGRENASRSVNSILFAYNNKGNLRIRFMDSESRFVYQTPPELFSRISEIMMNPRTSVNTKI